MGPWVRVLYRELFPPMLTQPLYPGVFIVFIALELYSC